MRRNSMNNGEKLPLNKPLDQDEDQGLIGKEGKALKDINKMTPEEMNQEAKRIFESWGIDTSTSAPPISYKDMNDQILEIQAHINHPATKMLVGIHQKAKNLLISKQCDALGSKQPSEEDLKMLREAEPEMQLSGILNKLSAVVQNAYRPVLRDADDSFECIDKTKDLAAVPETTKRKPKG